MKKLMLAALGAATMGFASPVMAQEWPVVPGDYWEVTAIKIDDGANLKYAQHMAGRYRASQDYAKSQGWITDYHILLNTHPREGEPDVYLVVIFDKWITAEEGERRAAQYREYMQTTVAKLEAESGERASYRTIAGTMLLRDLNWRN